MDLIKQTIVWLTVVWTIGSCTEVPPCQLILYTHGVPKGTYEVGIIHIRNSLINAKGIREVHFD